MRFSGFARIALAAGGLAALSLLASPVHGDIDIEKARPLSWMSLDKIHFFLDIAAFPTDTTTSRTEFYIRIPAHELTYPDTVEDPHALVRYELKLKNAKGKTIFKEKHEISVPPEETDTLGMSPGHVFLLSADLDPGWYEAELKLEDRQTQKIGLAYVGREAHRDGKIKGIFRVPQFARDRLEMSALEAVWGIVPAVSHTPFTRGRVNVFPNPSRTYGLFQIQAAVYYEIRDPAAEERTVQVTTRILDLEGNVLNQSGPNTLPVSGRSWSQAAFDVSSLLSGAYDVEVELDGGGDDVVRRRLRFNVAWSAGTWRGDPRAQADEVHLLVETDEEEEGFLLLSMGEREAYLDHYWKQFDPDLDTPRNEARERFDQRVAIANRQFGTRGMEKGMFTDRGRTFVRFGPPDEIQRENIPTHGLQVEDIARQIAEDEGLEFAVGLHGRGSIGADLRAFEIWYYDRLSREDDAEVHDVGPRRPMRRIIVFVDEEGYGNFIRRYSND
jgi:GWxTD domain-containing protein